MFSYLWWLFIVIWQNIVSQVSSLNSKWRPTTFWKNIFMILDVTHTRPKFSREHFNIREHSDSKMMMSFVGLDESVLATCWIEKIRCPKGSCKKKEREKKVEINPYWSWAT
jgi:hypothetical protein